jgi:hypothetical protein
MDIHLINIFENIDAKIITNVQLRLRPLLKGDSCILHRNRKKMKILTRAPQAGTNFIRTKLYTVFYIFRKGMF